MQPRVSSISVPLAQFSIAPSGSLSVAALLHLDLHTALEIDTNSGTRVGEFRARRCSGASGFVVDDRFKDIESPGEDRGKRGRVANTQYNDFWQH